MKRGLALLAAVLLLACSEEPLTQISVVIDKEPELELDQVRLEVGGPDKTAMTQEGAQLPRKVTLVREGDGLGPLLLTIIGRRAGKDVVEQKANVTFVAGQKWTLTIVLSASCQALLHTCSQQETCDAGSCKPIPNRTAEQAFASNTDHGNDTDPDPLGDEPPLAGMGTTRCLIEMPRKNQRLFEGDRIKLQGHCWGDTDEELETGLQWISDGNKVIADHATQTIQSDSLERGMHELRLCITTDASPQPVCSEALPVSMNERPPPPTGTIDSVQQKGVDGMTGPFSSGEDITFIGSAAAVGSVRLNWIDNYIADFGQSKDATMSSPRVGRHRVIMVVTDEANQNQVPPATAVFDVIEAKRFKAGIKTLVQPFANVNNHLRDAGGATIAALAIDEGGTLFVSNARQVFAIPSDHLNASAEPAVVDSDSGDATTLAGVRAMVIDPRAPDSRIYFGTEEGVRVCDRTRGELPIAASACSTYRSDPGNELDDEPVTALARLEVDSQRWLAVGTERGLWIARDDEDGRAQSSRRVSIASDGEAVTAVVSSGDSFWFTTSSAGIYSFNPAMDDNIAALFPPDELLAPLTTLETDAEGGIWLGTQEHGISRFDSKSGRWQKAWGSGPPFEGLASDRVQAIARTIGTSMAMQRAMVWAGTPQGLTRLDVKISAYLTLDASAGLPSDDVRALGVLPNGNLVIGTSEGVALYDGL